MCDGEGSFARDLAVMIWAFAEDVTFAVLRSVSETTRWPIAQTRRETRVNCSPDRDDGGRWLNEKIVQSSRSEKKVVAAGEQWSRSHENDPRESESQCRRLVTVENRLEPSRHSFLAGSSDGDSDSDKARSLLW